jgi:hypothetical protein
MPIIDSNSSANITDSNQYWTDELQNNRILLFELNKAILTLTTSNHQSYELNTGQSSQRVTRLDLSALISQRDDVMYKIRELEIFLGVGKPSIRQVTPAW